MGFPIDAGAMRRSLARGYRPHSPPFTATTARGP